MNDQNAVGYVELYHYDQHAVFIHCSCHILS